VAQNLARTNLKAKLKSGDAKILVEDAKFDAILLDAPCSATGTLRRNMETLWIKNPFDLPKLIEIQCELIRTAAAALKPGGRLVYAVCSLEPEEGDLAVASALEAGLKPDPITPDEVLNLDGVISPNGAARIMPYMLSEKGGLDGFFMARFVKP
jgi:16S rRNA (cytosine967-C5)-methyltransferase